MIFRERTTIWAEKYRPRVIDDYMCSDDLKSDIKTMIDKRELPHMLLCGTPGIGKTALAKLIINELGVDYLEINSNENMTMDSIRNKILPFAQSVPSRDLKIILLEEFHSINLKQQESLNYIIESYSDDTRFIITCNYSERILPAIKSRCNLYEISNVEKEDILMRCLFVLDSEMIEYDIDDELFLDDISNVITENYPDMRTILNIIQSRSLTGRYVVINKVSKVKTEHSEILDILNSNKSHNDKIRSIRQLIVNMKLSDFSDIYKFIYDNVDNVKGDLATNIILIGQFQYQDHFSFDKEINLMSMFSSIITQG